MRAYEFPVRVTPDGDLELPDQLHRLVAESREGRVILLLHETEDDTEDKAWSRLTAEQFFKGYAEARQSGDDAGSGQPGQGTAAALLDSNIVGMWKNRTDIGDSSDYARLLRQRAQRGR